MVILLFAEIFRLLAGISLRTKSLHGMPVFVKYF